MNKRKRRSTIHKNTTNFYFISTSCIDDKGIMHFIDRVLYKFAYDEKLFFYTDNYNIN